MSNENVIKYLSVLEDINKLDKLENELFNLQCESNYYLFDENFEENLNNFQNSLILIREKKVTQAKKLIK